MAIGINLGDEYRDLEYAPGQRAAFWESYDEEVARKKAVSRARHAILRKATARAHEQLEEFLNGSEEI